MVYEASSIRPQNAEKLQDVGRLLRCGRAKLTGSTGEAINIPEPLYTLPWRSLVAKVRRVDSRVVPLAVRSAYSGVEPAWRTFERCLSAKPRTCQRIINISPCSSL